MVVDVQTIRCLWPELLLVVCAAGIYLGGTLRAGRTSWVSLALAVYGSAAALILATEWRGGEHLLRTAAVTGPLAIDHLGLVARCVALFVGVLFTLLAARGPRRELTAEFLGTLMLLVAGLMLVARAHDLVLLFVSLELISLPTYVLLFLGRHDRVTSEATLKYFYLSILSSALLLYGLSFLYGLTGSTRLPAITAQIVTDAGVTLPVVAQLGINPDRLICLALVFVTAGLGFRLAVVPFHFYAADVYQGATHANAGLLAVVPKMAGVLAFVRLLVTGFPQAAALAWELLLVLAILTMTVGNVCALWQQNLRRLLAYSSIAHGGYLLIGLAVALAGSQQVGDHSGGIAATLAYVVVYSLAALGSFAAFAYLGGRQQEVSGVEDLSGLSRTHPWPAAILTICLFSLAGLPPLAGFWGKLWLFLGAVQTATGATTLHLSVWFTVLAVAGMLNAAIGAAYYLRVIAVMFFRAPHRTLPAQGGFGSGVVMYSCAALIVMVGIAPGFVLDLARDAELSARVPLSEVVDRSPVTSLRASDHAWHALVLQRTNW